MIAVFEILLEICHRRRSKPGDLIGEQSLYGEQLLLLFLLRTRCDASETWHARFQLIAHMIRQTIPCVQREKFIEYCLVLA